MEYSPAVSEETALGTLLMSFKTRVRGIMNAAGMGVLPAIPTHRKLEQPEGCEFEPSLQLLARICSPKVRAAYGLAVKSAE